MGIYKDLEGKRVVVTGAAGGIGLATAKRFISEGARVFILDWDEKALDKTTAENPKLSGSARGDVSNPDDMKKAFSEIDEILGGIDVLVSNAGISLRKPFLDIEYEEWSKILKVNLSGMFLCAQEAIKRMKKQKSGVVLFTASTNGMEGHPLYAAYNASKAGVILLAKLWRWSLLHGCEQTLFVRDMFLPRCKKLNTQKKCLMLQRQRIL